MSDDARDPRPQTVQRITACRPRALARLADAEEPICRWERDATAGGYRCRQCARWLAKGMLGHPEVARAMGDDPESDSSVVLADVLGEIEVGAEPMVRRGTAREDALMASAARLIVAARQG